MCMMWRRHHVCVLIILLLAGCQGNAGGTDAFEATSGIDPKVIAAWERAGAQFGWLVWSPDPVGSPQFAAVRGTQTRSLPAFKFKGDLFEKPQITRELGDLPEPTAPFAVDFQIPD